MKNFNLENLCDALVKNSKTNSMIFSIHPLDLVKIFMKKLDLHPKEASKFTLDLMKKLHGIDKKEAYPATSSGASIETNKQFPVPPVLKREAGNYIDVTPKLITSPGQEIPDARSRPSEWPFDGMTVAAMDPHARSPKRPLMQGAFDQDLDKNKPGGMGNVGTYMKNAPHSKTNSTPVSGRSWPKQGTPGWSSSPTGQQFNPPDALKPGEAAPPSEPVTTGNQEMEMPEEIPPESGVMNPSPVGSTIPQFNHGGRSPDRRLGFRRR